MTLDQLQQIVAAYPARADWVSLNNDPNFTALYWNLNNQVAAGNEAAANGYVPQLLAAYPLTAAAAATPVVIHVPAQQPQPAATIPPWLLWGGIGLAAYFLLK